MDSFSNRTSRQQAMQRPVAAAPQNAQGAGVEPNSTGGAYRQVPRPKQRQPLWKKIAMIAGGVVILALVGYAAWTVIGRGTGIDKGRYQAVFLTNGQVYFGKLNRMNSEYYELKDIYYLQASSGQQQAEGNNPQEAAPAGGDVQIIKLGEEVHGPEDRMIIGKDQVIFYENLKAKEGSKVVSAIADYQEKKK